MKKIAGITTKTDYRGREISVNINMRKHGNNALLEDFLDGQTVESRRGDETYLLDDVIQRQNKKRRLK